MLDSVTRTNKKYYPQTLLEECKYEIKQNKWEILSMNLIMNLKMNLMIRSENESNLLKVKTVFQALCNLNTVSLIL